MAHEEKPEIRLEINAGEFRIPTANAVYHIIVQAGEESSGTRLLNQIVDREKQHEPPPPAGLAITDEDFYKKVSEEVYQDIGHLARSLSATIKNLPAEDLKMKRVRLDEAGEKIEDAKSQLKDIVKMTEHAAMEIMDHVEKVQSQTKGVKELLSSLKYHNAFMAVENDPSEQQDIDISGSITDELNKLRDTVNQAQGIITELDVACSGEMPSAPETEPPPDVQPAGPLTFAIDTVFQAIYELCTNETVKNHIAGARKKAAAIFDETGFQKAINARLSDLVQEDGFLNIPLTAVLESLTAACTDKKVAELLKKLDAGKDQFFIDQTVPLEIPENVEPPEITKKIAGNVMTVANDQLRPRVAILNELLAGSLRTIQSLENLSSSEHAANQILQQSRMTADDQKEVFLKIEEAFNMAREISLDVSKITEVLSFQDLSGQQILKIIKLLSDFQAQLLALIVSFGSQLRHKEKKPEITPEESKRLAQEDVDDYINKLVGDAQEESGELDQESVNKILEKMGF